MRSARECFPGNIAALRRERGLSQRELAEVVGVNQTAVSSWERGGTMPSADALAPVIERFGIGYDDLLGDPEAQRRGEAPYAAGGAELAALAAGAAPSRTMPLPCGLEPAGQTVWLEVRDRRIDRLAPPGLAVLLDCGRRVPSGGRPMCVLDGSRAVLGYAHALEHGFELRPWSTDPTARTVAVGGKMLEEGAWRIVGEVAAVSSPPGAVRRR